MQRPRAFMTKCVGDVYPPCAREYARDERYVKTQIQARGYDRGRLN